MSNPATACSYFVADRQLTTVKQVSRIWYGWAYDRRSNCFKCSLPEVSCWFFVGTGELRIKGNDLLMDIIYGAIRPSPEHLVSLYPPKREAKRKR